MLFSEALAVHSVSHIHALQAQIAEIWMTKQVAIGIRGLGLKKIGAKGWTV